MLLMDESYFSLGFDRGNYASAYERSEPETLADEHPKSFRDGYLMGFFSSFELHEIPPEWRDELEELRRKYKEE
jgi:hypothetical protein